MGLYTRLARALFVSIAGVATIPGAQPAGPALLTYSEIQELYREAQPAPALQAKLTQLLTTPFVSNRAADDGVTPMRPRLPGLGDSLVVAQWNIERGLEFDAIRLALSNPKGFSAFLEDRGSKISLEERARVLDQVETLKQADVIVLNEVDWGVNRTLFRNVADELAGSLNMNYAYGVEFVEVDPITMGIDHSVMAQEVVEAYAPPGGSHAEAMARAHQIMQPDPANYHGLHGSAILSRYRLSNVRLYPFRCQGHDWYADEKKRTSDMEKAEGRMSEVVFREQLIRQVRRGGRMILMADLEGPGLPFGQVTVVATHLEDVTTPAIRRQQMRELLGRIQDIRHAVIVAGDMNTSRHEGLPIGLKQVAREHFGSLKWWAQQAVSDAIKYATPAGWVYEISHSTIGFARSVNDPTERSIPFLGENPEAKFFTLLQKFRFADGGCFDFRGDAAHAWHARSGRLANSNERAPKGFVATEELERTYGPVGEYKLDWIFVKPPGLTKPNGRGQSYWFAPQMARTMRRLNHAVPGRISDHSPITAALPLKEPESGGGEQAYAVGGSGSGGR